jgi:hypothetical protein
LATDHQSSSFEALGVPPGEIKAWTALGLEPFGAALARGDGFTPSFAVHYLRQLRRTIGAWSRASMDSSEGLRWHRAGFAARDATKWRSLGVDVDNARSRHGGYRAP